MITSTSVTWTCLPNGVVTTPTGAVASPLTLKLSLFASPQFVATAATDTISGSVFQNWPTIVRAITAAKGWNITFQSETNDAPSVTLATDYLSSSYLGVDGAALWSAIFPTTTPVASQPAVQPALQIHSFDAGAIATAVREAHRHVVASQVAGLGNHRTGSDPFSALLGEHAKARHLLPKVARALKHAPGGSTRQTLADAYEAETGSLGLGFELLRQQLFYDRGGHRAALRPDAAPVSPITGQSNANDVNTLIAHLGGQPELLRKLGLIVDLLVVPPANIVSQLSSTPVSIAIAAVMSSWWGSATGVANVEPMTSCDMSTSSFSATLRYPASAGPASLVTGMLPLSDSTQYSVQIEDVEGTPSKIDAATTAPVTDLAAPMPALRTAGFTITQTQREPNLATALEYQAQLVSNFFASGAPIAAANPNLTRLNAEDLVRGYRVDVAICPVTTTPPPIPPATAFQSVCLRDTRAWFPTYEAPGATTATGASLVLSDEGYLKGTGATSPIAAPTELDLHQAVFGWEGWSLAAQKPGRAITATQDPTDGSLQDETPLQPVNTPAGGFPTAELTVRPRAASLPRLRFGNWYSFRARAADLAGNDISTPTAVVAASKPVEYLRYEPVSSPVLVLTTPLTEGEHLERMVIRSNPYGATAMNAQAYANSFASTASPPRPATPMNPYAATNVRWIAPPKVAWGTAEAHGQFDVYLNEMSAAMKAAAPVPGVGYASAAFLAAKNTLYALSQKESGTFSTASVWNSATAATVTNAVTIVTPATAVNAPAPTTRGSTLSPGQYTIVPATSSVVIPYFPDPNALGVSLQAVITSASGTTLGAPVVRAWLPRAGCAWPEIDVPQLQLVDGTGAAASTVTGVVSMPASGAPAPPSASNAAIVVSLLPGTEMVLQSSSLIADVTKMASNDVGTGAGQIPAYAPTRDITLVHAVQQPKWPSPPALAVGARAEGQTNVALTGSIVADGPSTSQLDLTATWTEYVDTELTSGVEVEAGSNIRYVNKTGRVQTWTMNPTDGGITLPATPTSPAINHEFGDTKTRLVSYQAVATSRFREYFPAGLQGTAANFQNSSLTNPDLPIGTPNPPPPIRIPATARPHHPNVLYVVPTYQWSTSTASGTVTNTRLGGGLRVYVDRPWFTSGDTEYLAVLVNPTPGTTNATLNDYVTQWGLDPIQFPQGAQAAPFSAALPEGYAVSSVTPVPLAEGVGSVNVYGYSPTAFDTTRNLWYFDIEIAQQALEAPFVRLALARYQPNAIVTSTTDLRLSSIVRADMVKLSADRTAAYVVNANNTVAITVTGRVFDNEAWSAGQAAEAMGRAVMVQVMQTAAANPGEFDWTVVSTTGLSPSQQGGNASTLLSFTGTVTIPTTAGAKYQLLVTELEILPTDAPSGSPTPWTAMNNPVGALTLHSNAPTYLVPGNGYTTSRVLFSDVLPLP